MSWRDNLLPASYKGVSFGVQGSIAESGRRTELKQFANNDAPYLQDFGQDASTFEVEGFIIAGPSNNYDYFIERDALIAAFSEIGAGELVHPFYGTRTVYPLGKLKLSETSKEGGIARISMKFVEINEEVQKLILPSFKKQQPNLTLQGLPTDSEDFNNLIDDAITTANNDAADSLANTFTSSRSFPDKLSGSITEVLKKVQQAVFKVKGTFSSLIAKVTGTLATLLATTSSIVNTPCTMFTSLLSMAETLGTLCGIGENGVFGGSAGYCSGKLRGEVTELNGETVPSELGQSCITQIVSLVDDLDENNFGFIPDSQLNNIISMIDISKYSLLVTSMKVAVRTNFIDKGSTITYANLIAEAIENFLERLGAETDESNYNYIEGYYLDNTFLFSAMEDLRNIFIQAMYAKASLVSTIVDYKVPSEIISVLELAYDKYEDLNRQDEIYTMNLLDIQHPGFLPSGDIIRILNE